MSFVSPVATDILRAALERHRVGIDPVGDARRPFCFESEHNKQSLEDA